MVGLVGHTAHFCAIALSVEIAHVPVMFRRVWYCCKFSEVSFIVILYSAIMSELAFENVYQCYFLILL